MTENSTDYSCDLELIEERLKNIESLLFTLQSNAPYLELEPFEAGEEGLPIENTGLENFIDGLGLRYFRGRELTPYWSRTCGSIRNSAPPQSLWNNLGRTLKVLDRLRDEIGHPIRITSSYRDPDYNASSCVGGEPNSQHSAGKALDFVAAGGTPDQWGAKLKSYRGQTFTLPGVGSFVFRGGVGIYQSRNFVHLDTRGTDADWFG